MHQRRAPTVRVWDRFTRVFHWTLVAAFATAYLSTQSIGWVHKGAGYLTLALVAARVVWGFKGSPSALFHNFVPGRRHLYFYLRAVLQRKEPRHLGHNPAGAAMILVLMAAVVGIGATGFMMTTDAFWGNEWVENLHTLLVDATLVAVAVHITANIYGSWRHRENLILSMVTGHKPLDVHEHQHEPVQMPASNPTSAPAPRPSPSPAPTPLRTHRRTLPH